MFEKVLVSDDLDSINLGVASILKELGVKDVLQVQYCDDAYLKIKSACLQETPIDLFITDLSFQADHRDQNFKSGEALISILKKEHPKLKIIVYSVEDRTQLIKKLVQEIRVDGYVCKGRNGLKELKEAVLSVSKSSSYTSPQLTQLLKRTTDFEIDTFDIELMRLLSLGKSQEDISHHFKENHVSPSSLSSIEKRLNRLRIQFKANNAIHLVSIVKDIGLI